MPTLSEKCIPFVSEYTDCTEANLCSGCTKCYCTPEGDWSCDAHSDCTPHAEIMGDEEVDYALNIIQHEIAKKKQKPDFEELVPRPERLHKERQTLKRPIDRVLDHSILLQQDMAKYMLRETRSVTSGGDNNETIKYHNVIDELNEDTLKNSNISGTLEARKVEPKLIKTFRRKENEDSMNVSTIKDLHIYSSPNVNDLHLSDNKIDSKPHDVYLDLMSNTKLAAVSNISKNEKNKVLSKLVVSELKTGEETIGDKNAPPTSNITFTPENDSLTAIAFIAGNLLNKLWKLEGASDESIETEILKHEKISELIELFKEPLTVKQESFLKNALVKLSNVIYKHKEIKNVSICHEIGKFGDGEERDSNQCNGTQVFTSRKTDETNPSDVIKEQVTMEAIKKLNNVLDLIKKFEDVQKHLTKLKHAKNDYSENNLRPDGTDNYDSFDAHLTEDESKSLNLFGGILEKVTKLFIPSNHKVHKSRTNTNILKDSINIPHNLKEKYGIDRNNLSRKDKLILDYLSKVQNNPRCSFPHSNFNGRVTPNVEGDILYNLSEFFKIKSFVDLVKLMEPEKEVVRASVITTTAPKTTTTTTETTTFISSHMEEDSKKFSETKQKLKIHLKTIIDDLVEMQKDKPTAKGELEITNALPCLYNLVNNEIFLGIQQERKSNLTAPVALRDTLQKLKEDLYADTLPFRRTNEAYRGERPKSAIVLERIVNSLNENRKSRRNIDGSNPKSFEQLIKIMNMTDFEEKHNKTSTAAIKVDPDAKLMLLKSMQFQVRAYSQVLNSIRASLDLLRNEPKQNMKMVDSFIDQTASNLNFKRKIIHHFDKKIGHTKIDEYYHTVVSNQEPERNLINDFLTKKDRKTIKLSRKQIVNQLIKNRIEFYIKIKESQGVDSEDINYKIAQNILRNLELGNSNVAKELYKVFVSANAKNKTRSSSSNLDSANDRIAPKSLKYSMIHQKPSTQMENAKPWSEQLRSMSKDQLIKQLLTMKSM